MPTSRPRPLLEIEYYEAAQAYLKSLPPEHFMEARPQGVQREITLESLAVIRRSRPDVHYYNELLVQYRLRPNDKIRQVVPDNLVVRHEGELAVEGSYDVELQPARPFWTLEYVSKSNKRKDYDENFDRYEKELKVPYYLLFYPDHEELTLYRRGRSKYVSVKPDSDGRLAIEEIETQAALVGNWVRFWFRGNLVPLPAELQGQVDELTRQLQQKDAALAKKDAELAQKDAEIARLRALLTDRGA
jgi:Uma2 family endonuclease